MIARSRLGNRRIQTRTTNTHPTLGHVDLRMVGCTSLKPSSSSPATASDPPLTHTSFCVP